MKYEYTILIPSWNNLALLQNCIRSIKEHSRRHFQILVYVNEGNDGTAAWLTSQDIQFLSSDRNVGICIAMNALRQLVKAPIICYLNDDMYVLPEWDDHVLKEITTSNFFYSSTMIEPNAKGNRCSIDGDFGQTLEDFEEEELIKKYPSFEFKDWNGSSWPPLWVSTELWDKIGGFSEEFSPGMYSDPDMAMKAWKLGVRLFRGISASRVYHFGSKTTKRPGMNEGRKLFIAKWGITSRYFYKYYLHMGKPFAGGLSMPREPIFGRLINKVKTLINQ